jgi:hypothetical protein
VGRRCHVAMLDGVVKTVFEGVDLRAELQDVWVKCGSTLGGHWDHGGELRSCRVQLIVTVCLS